METITKKLSFLNSLFFQQLMEKEKDKQLK